MTVAITFGKATPVGFFSIDVTLFAPKNVEVGIVRLPESDDEEVAEEGGEGEGEGEQDKGARCKWEQGRRKGEGENRGSERREGGGGNNSETENETDENLSVTLSVSDSEVTSSYRFSASVSPALPDFEEGEGHREGQGEGDGDYEWKEDISQYTVRAAHELDRKYDDVDEDGLDGTKFDDNDYHSKSNMKLHSNLQNAGVSNHSIVSDSTVDHDRFYDNNGDDIYGNENGKRVREVDSVSRNVGDYLYDNNENNNDNKNNNNNDNYNDININYYDKNDNFDHYENSIPPFNYKSSNTVSPNSIQRNGKSTFTKIGFFTELNIFDFYSNKEEKNFKIHRNKLEFNGNFVEFENLQFVDLMSNSSYLNLFLVLSERLCLMPCDIRLWVCTESNNESEKYNKNKNNSINSILNNSNCNFDNDDCNNLTSNNYNNNNNYNDYNNDNDNHYKNKIDPKILQKKNFDKKYQISRYIDFAKNSNQIIKDFIFYIEILNGKNMISDDLFESNYRCIGFDEDEWISKLKIEIMNNKNKNIPYSAFQSTDVNIDNDHNFEKNYTSSYGNVYNSSKSNKETYGTNHVENEYEKLNNNDNNSNYDYHNDTVNNNNNDNGNNYNNNYSNSNNYYQDNSNNINNTDFHEFDLTIGCGLGSSNQPLHDTNLLSYSTRNNLIMNLNLLHNDVDELFKYYSNKIEDDSVLLFIKLLKLDIDMSNDKNEIISDNDIQVDDCTDITNDVDEDPLQKTSTSTSSTTSLCTIGSIIIDQYTTYTQVKVMLDSLISPHSTLLFHEKQKKIGESSNLNNNQNTANVLSDSLFYSFVHSSPLSFSDFTRAELEGHSDQFLNSSKFIKQVADYSLSSIFGYPAFLI